jgi:TP901 family phage tail tape measure protein
MDGYTYLIKVDSNGNAVLPALANNANKADVSLRKAGTGSEKAFTKTGTSIGRARDEMGRFTSSSKRGFGTLQRSANRSNATLSKTRSLLAGIGLTLTAGAIATGIIGTGAGFEKSMSNVASLTQAAKTELVSLNQAARDAGATTAYSAKESADSMGYLAQAGYKTNQIIDALPATLNLAAAGSLDLARSADIATNILSQYRMKAQDTGVVVDQLAFTQANFNTNIEEMSDAMNYFGPTAAALKIGLSESSATIGLMANNGLKGSLATRALSSSIVRLTNPTTKMQTQMDKLNLSFFDGEGHFVGMAGMVDTLSNGLEGLTDKQRQAALSTIFGTEAIQEINILLSEGGEKIRDWTEKLDGAEGAAKRMADTKLDNLAGDFQILKSTSQEFALGFHEKINPTLRALTKEATLFIRSMDTKEVGLYAQKFFLGLRKGLIWLEKNKRTIVGIGKGYVTLKVAMLAYNAGTRAGTLITGAYNATLVLTKTGASGATLAVRGLNTALKANPFGLILGAITAVVAAVTLFRDRTKEATAEQIRLNNIKLQGEVFEKEANELRYETSGTLAKIDAKPLGDLNERQLKQLHDEASIRLERAEDFLFDLEGKSGVNLRDYDALASQISEEESKEWSENSTEMSSDELQAYMGLTSKKAKLDKMGQKLEGATLTTGKITVGELRDLLSQNESIINKTKSLIKDETVTGLGVSGSGVSGSGTASEMSERIVSGGTSQKIVNVSLGKFLDEVVFNVNGASDVIDRKDEILETFMEGFSRVLNSANQMVN